MSRLDNFFLLSTSDQVLFFKTLFAESGIRFALWLAPFHWLFRSISRLRKKETQTRLKTSSPARIVWAVKSASRFVPAATCLVQALTAHIFLLRRGHESLLIIGVKKGAVNDFKAHAWLRCDGAFVIGEDNIGDFRPILTVEGR